MKELMMAIEDLETAQMDLLKHWLHTCNTLEQQNQLLSQQVDYLENRIVELEQKLLEASKCPLMA